MVTYTHKDTTITINRTPHKVVVVLNERCKDTGYDIVRWYEIDINDYHHESQYNMVEWSKSLSSKHHLHNALERTGVTL